MACIGFAFDTYVLLVLTLIVRPALLEMLPPNAGPAVFNRWVGLLFYVPAIAGGVFGLLGGYLIDLLGRRRILLWSILLYGACTFASAYVTSPAQFLLLRCGTFVGVSVEFVAATAWLAELFTHRERREAVIGYTQGFASTGGLLISAAYYIAVTYSQRLPLIHGGHAAWRYTAMSGLIPAIPLIVLRPFLPESPIWKRKKAEGTLKRPSFAELFRPAFRKTALITCLMMACSYAASFGMLQHFARIIPGTPGVRLLPVAAQEQRVSAIAGRAGDGRPRRTPADGFSRRAHPEPQATAALISNPRVAADSAGNVLARRARRGYVHNRNLRAGFPDRGAVQLLGKLSAARLPNVSCAAQAKLLPPTSAAACWALRPPCW